MADEIATIYEWAGGRSAFVRWLNRFYDLIELEAPEIAAMFGGKVSEEHRAHVTDWWVDVMGGPAAYTERRGGYGMGNAARGSQLTPRSADGRARTRSTLGMGRRPAISA